MIHSFRRMKPRLSHLANMHGLWRRHPRYRECVGHWAFVEGAGDRLYDISAYGNHGTLTNMDPTTDWVPGQFGDVLDFDGANDIVDIVKHPIFDLLTFFNVSCWMRPTSSTGTLVCIRDGDPTQFALYLSGTSSLNVRGGIVQWTSTGSDFSLNVWSHVSVNFGDAGTAPSVYINGRLVTGHNGQVLTLASQNFNLAIGARWAGYPTTGYPFPGQIDDVRIYNRQLSEQEILSLVDAPLLEFGWAQQQLLSLEESWDMLTASSSRMIYQQLIA